MCLEFATDLNINPLLCPGVRGNFSYQSAVTFFDVREPAIVAGNPLPNYIYEMYSVFVPEGV